jgi:hypothetical protein
MRTQYCRDHIDKTAEMCGLSVESVREIKKAADFADQHPEFRESGTNAIIRIMRIKDPEVKALVVLSLRGALRRTTPTGGRYKTSVSEADVKMAIKKASHTSEPCGGACDICGAIFSKMCVPHKDHDHKTGRHRGCLCRRCNTAIGLFEDNEELMHQAISYLHRWNKDGG